MITTLREKWKLAGINEGDTVLIHSNIKRTLLEYRRNGTPVTPQDILDSFIDVIGTKGTLLFPLFNFEFTRGVPFNIRSTESQMGTLTEVARKHNQAVRTGHPVYSFAVIGYKAPYFFEVDNRSGYSEESPFGLLKNFGGKIACLDLDDQNSMTFYHHVEEVNRVDYRHFKSFTGEYTNMAGETKSKTYDLYVRNLDQGVITNVNPAGELMWKAGIYKGFRPNEGPGLRTILANDMFRFVQDIIESGNALGTLYSIKG